MRGRHAALALGAAIAAACGAPVDGPPTILYGEDVCDRCHMVISDERYAAAARGPAGEVLRFDDLGCLLADPAVDQEAGWRVWVHDRESAAWLRAAAARFVRRDGGTTPMGSGWTATAAPPRETAFLGWEEVRRASRAGAP